MKDERGQKSKRVDQAKEPYVKPKAQKHPPLKIVSGSSSSYSSYSSYHYWY